MQFYDNWVLFSLRLYLKTSGIFQFLKSQIKELKNCYFLLVMKNENI